MESRYHVARAEADWRSSFGLVTRDPGHVGCGRRDRQRPGFASAVPSIAGVSDGTASNAVRVASSTASLSGLCVGSERWLTQVRQASIRPRASTGEPASGSADAPVPGFAMPSGTTCPSPSPRRRGRSDQPCPAHCAGRATSSRRATPTLSSTSPPRGVPCGSVGRASSTGARKRTIFQTEGTVTRSASRTRMSRDERAAIFQRLRKAAGMTLSEMAALLRVPVRSLTRGDAATLARAAKKLRALRAARSRGRAGRKTRAHR